MPRENRDQNKSGISDVKTKLGIVGLLLIAAVLFLEYTDSWSARRQGTSQSAHVLNSLLHLPPSQRNRWNADGSVGSSEASSASNTPASKRLSPRTVSRWVDEDQIGATPSPTPSKLSNCPYRVPSVSKKTRELLQGRDFTAALDFANGEADGFMREFIHARPFANSTMFDWVIRKGKRIYGNVNEDPARILSDTSWQSLGYLNSDSIASLSDKPSMKRGLVFAETDDHNSGWAVPPDQNWSIKCCEWEKLKRNQRPKEYKGWWCFCQTEAKSTPASIDSLVASGRFASIAWEAMDVPQRGLRPTAIPFTTDYSKMASGSAGRSILAEARSVDVAAKKGILAAWGTAWPKLDHLVQSRIEAIKWLTDNPLVQRSSVPPYLYHKILASHRFALCPTGGGVQSPKVFEAIILKTIPIVQRKGAAAYVGLAELGFPLAIVDEWEEVTESQMDKWWEDLSPMLDRARWMMLTEVWFAFVSFPCPIDDIYKFLDYLSVQE